MRFPELDGVPLAALEAAAAPLAVLGTLLVVVLGGLGATAVRAVATRSGAGAAVAGAAAGLVALATVLVLAAAAGLAVEAYRRRFRRTGGGTQLLVGLFVPAVGVLAPLSYAAVEFGTLSPPWWVLGAAAVAATAAALRTVAMYSTARKHRRRGSLVGAVAALPVAVALVDLVTERFLGGAVAAAGRRVGGWLAATGVPHHGLLVVVPPLVVAGAYGASRARSAPANASNSPDTSLPRSPTLPEPSRVPDTSLRGAAVYLRERTPLGLPDLGDALRASTSEESSGPRSRDTSDVARPPVSARSSTDRGRASGGGADSDRGSTESGPGGAGSSDRGGSGTSGRGGVGTSDASGSSGDDHGRSDSASEDGTSEDGTSEDRASDDGASDSGGLQRAGRSRPSSTDDGEDATADGDAATGAGASADGGAHDDGTGSDTRIFTGDFGSYGEDAAERCPACEETIPSDGVYRFCPFCGEQL